jgi:dCMP deaminase
MSADTYSRPDMDEYFMGIAMAVRRRANCMGNRVGAVIVKDSHIVSTGYNGTPHGMPNCMEGGCHRCAHRADYPSGSGYDLCICVHAEQNALLQAARFGIAVEGATLYSTMRPCFGCTKELLQAKVQTVFYLHDWSHPDERHNAEYERLQGFFPGGMRLLAIDDPEESWAVSSKRAAVPPQYDETGHDEN